MRPFIHDDFLLHSEVAKYLYHNHAQKMPIIDFHCHLDPKEIYEDHGSRNIVDLWLSGDHYKWRLMRANGVDESYITGNKPSRDKFRKWAEVVELLVGNPLYHWTHLELKRFFEIDHLLGPDTAMDIYKEVNDKLAELSPRKLIEMSNVEAICTTDDPIDDLKWHELLSSDKTMKTKVLPAFRPDKGLNIEQPGFVGWTDALAKVVGSEIKELEAFKRALKERIAYFHAHGCRLSDHALDFVNYEITTEEEVALIFERALRKEALSRSEIRKFKGNLLVFLGRLYHEYGWVQQYHIGALRNVSSRMFGELGADTGYDSINDSQIALPLSQLLNTLDQTKELPKTILYTLNPSDYEVAVTMMQAFQGDNIPGKIQFGAPWWFLDNIDGTFKQIKALGNNALLARFVGMLTDSRSFLSYPRHEYFRRILCDFLGSEVEQGHFPENLPLLGKMVEDISYYNANNYFNF